MRKFKKIKIQFFNSKALDIRFEDLKQTKWMITILYPVSTKKFIELRKKDRKKSHIKFYCDHFQTLFTRNKP